MKNRYHQLYQEISAFSASRWNDYNWIDSFLDKMEESISMEKFFDSINWNTIYPMIRYLSRIRES